MDKRRIKIAGVLEDLYHKYNHREFIKPDPLQFIYNYSNSGDMEIVGFLAASLAYGRVQQIEKSLNNLLKHIGSKPYKFVLNFDNRKRAQLKSFKHRFNSGNDISDLFVLLQKVLKKYGSIEKYFLTGYKDTDVDIIPALTNFSNSLVQMHTSMHRGRISDGLKYLLVSPAGGSACKRLNLFLRWMVRDDNVDAGLWKSIDKSKLIVPVDVHMGRLCRILGFHNRKTVSLSTASEITQSFKEIEPNDPVKHDFALSRIGIVENCNGKQGNYCQTCELLFFCRKI